MNKKEKVFEVITRPIPKELIKQRDAGNGKSLDYISGETAIRLLNEAFDYEWDWIVQEQWAQDSIPFFNKYSKEPAEKKVTVNGQAGAYEQQAPTVHVKGLLTTRYLDDEGNIVTIQKSGLGSKSIIGKQSEQESIYKSAGTDALKKAATLLGIGLDLYGGAPNNTTPKPTYDKKQPYSNNNYNKTQNNTYTAPANTTQVATWETKSEDVKKFKELKVILGVSENKQLDPYAQEFTGNKSSTYEAITPDNISAFNIFLLKKAESI